jgi:hypothetical protein
VRDFDGTLDGCKAAMTGPHCLSHLGIDDSYTFQESEQSFYGLRRRMKDGQTILDQAQLDACVAELTAMTAGRAACGAQIQNFFEVKCMTAFKGQIPLGDACKWYPSNTSEFKYTFIPCKEGRCEEGKCVPLLKAGDMCDGSNPIDGPGACDYLHDEACYVDVGVNASVCGPRKEIGEACEPFDGLQECKSANCDASHTCAPATPKSACF